MTINRGGRPTAAEKINQQHRLYLARKALLEGDSRSTKVTDVAIDHGFYELGRFAASYKALFGELPSVTLQREPQS